MTKEFNELLDRLKESNLSQSSYDWMEDAPKEIYDKYLKDNFTEVASGLYIDKHRWHETSLTVIKVFDMYLGVRLVSNLYSEMSDWSDIGWQYKFFPMEEVQITSYQIIE